MEDPLSLTIFFIFAINSIAFIKSKQVLTSMYMFAESFVNDDYIILLMMIIFMINFLVRFYELSFLFVVVALKKTDCCERLS